MKRLLFVFALLLIGFKLFPQERDGDIASDSVMLKYAETITQKDLRTHLEIVASDSFGGRDTGSEGQQKAAAYLSQQFKNMGLQGPVRKSAFGNNPFHQHFNIIKTNWYKCEIISAKKILWPFKHFYPFREFSIPAQKREVVFVGYGIENEEYSDYEGLDVKGKVVVMLKGNTEIAFNNKTYVSNVTDAKKVSLAWQKGADLVVLAHDDNKEFKDRNTFAKQFYYKVYQDTRGLEPTYKAGLIFTSPAATARLLNVSKKEFLNAIQEAKATNQQLTGRFQASAYIDGNVITSKITTENVLAYLPGSDKSAETLVISAHYDHVGIKGGMVFNGADDDGSGTVALLEMAQAFSEAAKAGYRPRRSILFMAFTGEEKGLLGSKYYTANPILPLKNVIADLNVDMIGRVDDLHHENSNYVYTIGSDFLSKDLHQVHAEVSEKYFPTMTIDYKYNSTTHPERLYYRSDHYSFAKHNIPVIFYTNGSHPDYHKPTDTVDKIAFKQLENRTKLVFMTAWKLANADEAPKVNKSTHSEIDRIANPKY